MFATILTFLRGPYGALLEKALFALLIVGGIFMVYRDITGHAAADQRLRDQNAQIAQLRKDEQSLNKTMAIIEQDNKDILIKLNQQNGKVIETHDNITHYIETQPNANQQPVPPVIGGTIGMLYNDQ
jgi:preprotein translocase subunit SecF